MLFDLQVYNNVFRYLKIKSMKTKTLLSRFVLSFYVVILFPVTNINAQHSVKTKQEPSKEQRWFDEKKWLEGAVAFPDTGIDETIFASHYEKHPERWKKVFEFLKENNLSTLPLGKQSLGEDVTVNVQEYMTREPGNEQLEGHKKYIDLQYVVDGCELQGYAKLATALEVVNPYDEKRDVVHYKVPVIEYHVVRPDHFTIFFPDDIHMTNIQYGEKAKVRKVVFKIAVD